MQDSTNSQQPVYVPVTTVNAIDLIRQLVDDNAQLKDESAQLRKILEENNTVIDRLTNSMAFQNELIQQLRDEIATLKGQKPKPKIPPSKLEGTKSKTKWHERFKKIPKSEKSIVFASWVNNFVSCITPSASFRTSTIAKTNTALQIRAYDISRLIKSIVKKVKRKRSKPGQPNGRPRTKKEGMWKFTIKFTFTRKTSLKAQYLKDTSPILFRTLFFSHTTLSIVEGSGYCPMVAILQVNYQKRLMGIMVLN